MMLPTLRYDFSLFAGRQCPGALAFMLTIWIAPVSLKYRAIISLHLDRLEWPIRPNLDVSAQI